MLVDVATFLPCAPHEVVKHVKTPRLLMHVAYPLVRFIPRDPAQLPETWAEGTYWMSLYLFGFIPFGKQAVVSGGRENLDTPISDISDKAALK